MELKARPNDGPKDDSPRPHRSRAQTASVGGTASSAATSAATGAEAAGGHA